MEYQNLIHIIFLEKKKTMKFLLGASLLIASTLCQYPSIYQMSQTILNQLKGDTSGTHNIYIGNGNEHTTLKGG